MGEEKYFWGWCARAEPESPARTSCLCTPTLHERKRDAALCVGGEIIWCVTWATGDVVRRRQGLWKRSRDKNLLAVMSASLSQSQHLKGKRQQHLLSTGQWLPKMSSVVMDSNERQ